MIAFPDLPDPYTLVGVVGACTYICNYCALSFQKISSASIAYYAINACAALCVMTSMLAQVNLPTLIIQGFYLTVSLCAIGLRIAQRRRARWHTARLI